MRYIEAETYINQIPKFSKQKSRDNTEAILKEWHHPEQSFEYIHVAGTNGKGSVCVFLSQILIDGGKKTGLFTSPHLLTTRERIQINGEMISEEDFVLVFVELKRIVDARMAKGFPHPTYFEWLYLMAMYWFGKNGIEYGIIETGLGGRLDATNLIKKPAITVITSISFDHTEILGDTLTDIAYEKAGIIKKGVPVVYDGNDEEVVDVIEKVAVMKESPVTVFRKQQIKKVLNVGKNIAFLLEDSYHEIYKIHLNTTALYQMMNSSLALLTMRELQKKDSRLENLSIEQMLKSIESMHWPGRMEEILPNVFVDGAHNPGGIYYLAKTLKEKFYHQSIWLVFAVANDKNFDQMIEQLINVPNLKGVIVTEIDNSRKTDLHIIKQMFEKKWHGLVDYSYNIREAILKGQAYALGSKDAILLCTGSLYLAGSVLETLIEKEDNQEIVND